VDLTLEAPTAGAAAESPRWLPTLAAVVAVALAGWALTVGRDDAWREIVRLGLVALWASAAIGLARRRSSEHIATLVAVIAVAAGVAAAGAALLADGRSESTGALARAAGLAALPAAALHLLLGLPSGKLETTNRRATVAVAYATSAVAALYLYAERPDLPAWPIVLSFAVWLTLGMSLSNARYRRARGTERQRMQWFGWAAAVTVELLLVGLALRLLIDWPPAGLAALATVPIPLALWLGASPRLVSHVDRLLAHTVSAAGLTAVIIAVYVVIVIGLGRVPNDDEKSLLALSMVAAGVAAVLWLPARDRLSQFANRLVYGERHAPDEALRTFGTRMTRAIPMDELLLQLAESLRKTMVLHTAEVWTGSADRLERAVSVPERGPAVLALGAKETPVVSRAGVSGPAWAKVWLEGLMAGREDHVLRVAPATHAGELFGLLVADRGRDGDAFGEEEERVIGELARQVGAALNNVKLDSALQASLEQLKRQAAELQASRARIVAAGDAERRKIERNLHDGAQQHLVALAVNLRLAKTIAGKDPDKATQMLDQLVGDVQDTLQELRALAHGIYPPLLMERGLPEALQAAAGRATIPTQVEAGEIGRFSSDIEAAVYFCCLEALQNAGKYAGEAASAWVRVWRENGLLRFEVTDTGAGFDTAAGGAGAGFVNMGDRLGAIGGSFQVESGHDKGTRISGQIPVGD
jgi:signal transduction histidine kinase